jgi:hypothetical protein
VPLKMGALLVEPSLLVMISLQDLPCTKGTDSDTNCYRYELTERGGGGGRESVSVYY